MGIDAICPLCGSKDFEYYLSVKDRFVSGETFDIVACSRCGFKWTMDAPEGNAMDAYYQASDYISHSDTKSGSVNYAYHRVRSWMLKKKIRWIENTLSPEASKKHLDIGCGTGYFIQQMRNQGWCSTGVENNAVARQNANTLFDISAYPSIEKCAQSEPSGTIDVITLWHVLEHLESLPQAMIAFQNLLKTNGLLVIAVPNATSYDARRYKAHWAAYDVPRHRWHFSSAHILMLAKQHGFSLVKTHAMPFDAFYISMLSEKYRNSSHPILKGIFTGIGAWFATLKNAQRSSSLTFILRKQ